MVDKLNYCSGNSASTTLSSGITASDTSAPLTSDTNFAAKSGEGMVIIDEGTANEEFAYATTKSGGALTIPLANRGLEGGSATTHSSGASVKGILTAGMWNNLVDALILLIDKTAGTIKTGITFASVILNGFVAKGVVDLGTVGTTETVNWASGDRQKMTLDENLTITFSNAAEGQTLTLYMLQDGTGTNTITFSNTIIWSDATTPTWTTTASKMNIAVITYVGSAYYGVGNKFV